MTGNFFQECLEITEKTRGKFICNPQAGTEIAWIGHAIKHQQKGWFLQRIQHIVQMQDLVPALYNRQNTLMFGTWRHAIKPLAVTGNELDAQEFGYLGDWREQPRLPFL